MTPYLADPDVTLWHGDALQVLQGMADGSADASVTSPPYLDARPEYPSPTLDEFGAIFWELARVVDGPLLLNVGRLFRRGYEVMWWTDLIEQANLNGWPLRDTLIWGKPNANPIQGEILTNAHEYVFMLGAGLDPGAVRTPYPPSTLARYGRGFAANAGVKGHDRPLHRRYRPVGANEAGARPRSYVLINTGREKGNPHPAPMALDLAVHLVKLSGGLTVLDPFAGSGTTGIAARKLGRSSVLIERDADYCALAAKRLQQLSLLAEAGS